MDHDARQRDGLPNALTPHDLASSFGSHSVPSSLEEKQGTWSGWVLAALPAGLLGSLNRSAGGFSFRADKGKVSVKYANGEMRTSKKTLFFSSSPRPGPGSEVFAPVRDTTERVN